jgi:diaminopimelate epimerase
MAGWTFHKMHGLGNDFVVLDRRAGGPEVTPRWSARSLTGGAVSDSTSWP